MGEGFAIAWACTGGEGYSNLIQAAAELANGRGGDEREPSTPRGPSSAPSPRTTVRSGLKRAVHLVNSRRFGEVSELAEGARLEIA
jgi:hypothetical protein